MPETCATCATCRSFDPRWNVGLTGCRKFYIPLAPNCRGCTAWEPNPPPEPAKDWADEAALECASALPVLLAAAIIRNRAPKPAEPDYEAMESRVALAIEQTWRNISQLEVKAAVFKALKGE